MIVVLTLLALALIGSGFVTAHFHGVANVHAAANVQKDSAIAGLAKDLTRERARAFEANREAERVRLWADSTVADLNARLHDLTSANEDLIAMAEAEIAEHDGWVRAETHRMVVANLERTVLVTDSLRAVEAEGRLVERARGDAMEGALLAATRQIAVMEERDVIRVAEIEALRKASGSFWPPLKLQSGLVVGAAVTLGYLLGSAR